MSFIWPTMLLSLLILPPLAALYWRAQRRRRGLIARYGSLGLVQGGTGRFAWRRHLPPALFLVGLAILGTALARPQATVALPRAEGTVILAFDISGSMAADDLKPSRMEAAKAAAREFVHRQPPAAQIGVVAFSDSGLATLAPTIDREATLAAIDRLAPARGTSLANGILASLATIAAANSGAGNRYYTNLTPTAAPTPTPVPKGTYTPAAIVLLTDGENTIPPNPLAAAQAAAARGVRVYTVGIGSAAGTPLKIEGFVVQTRLDEATLKGIADLTGGAYFNATDEAQLSKIYEGLGTGVVVRPERTEVTALFSGAGLLVLLLGGALSLLWFGRLP
jgi:Ca-activated chloride channel homolog